MARSKKDISVPEVKVIDNAKAFPKEQLLAGVSVVVVLNKETGIKKRMSASFAKLLINSDSSDKYKIL